MLVRNGRGVDQAMKISVENQNQREGNAEWWQGEKAQESIEFYNSTSLHRADWVRLLSSVSIANGPVSRKCQGKELQHFSSVAS